MERVYALGKNSGNNMMHVNTKEQFLSEMGFEPIMRRGTCDCIGRDCLCLIDPFATAGRHNVKIDNGESGEPAKSQQPKISGGITPRLVGISRSTTYAERRP